MRHNGRVYRVPYFCPLEDSNPRAPVGEFAECLVRTTYGKPRSLLTQVLVFERVNLVLHELYLNGW